MGLVMMTSMDDGFGDDAFSGEFLYLGWIKTRELYLYYHMLYYKTKLPDVGLTQTTKLF